MKTETGPTKPTERPKLPPASPELEALIDEQGVRETATFERVLGMGADLWDSDEEFEEFIKLLAQRRKEPG